LESPSTGIYPKLAKIQEKTAFMPDYDLKSSATEATDKSDNAEEQSWPDINTGTSLSGVIGGTLTLLLASLIGVLLRFRTAGKNP
jgi:cobalt/nickel transport system permease protein